MGTFLSRISSEYVEGQASGSGAPLSVHVQDDGGAAIVSLLDDPTVMKSLHACFVNWCLGHEVDAAIPLSHALVFNTSLSILPKRPQARSPRS